MRSSAVDRLPPTSLNASLLLYRIIRGVVSQCNGLWRVGGLDCQRVSFTLTSTQHIVVVLHMTSTTECVTILGREIQTKFDIEKTLFSSPSHPPTIEWQYYLSRESCWSPKILLISSFISPFPLAMSRNIVRIG